MTDATESAADRRRGIPLPVVVIALLIVANSILGITALLGYRQAPEGSGSDLITNALGTDARFFTIIHVVAIIAAIALLRGMRSGWFAVMVLTGVGLAFDLITWWAGHPDYLRMALWVFVAFYLNQRDVRAIYEGGRRSRDTITLEVSGARGEE